MGIALTWLLGCSQSGEGAPAPPPRPNVVLIVLDTTRADILSAYGYPKPTSPSLSLVASEGILFKQAITTDFWTLPAHASLLTGKYPTAHQANSETMGLAPRAKTLAEYLGGAGYKTRAYVSNPWIGIQQGFDQGFQAYFETWKTNPGSHDYYGLDQWSVENAEQWIEKTSLGGDPFFLFLNLNSAHMPYSPNPMALVDLSPAPRPLDRTRELKRIKGMWTYLAGEYGLTEEDFEILRELYAAEVSMVDGLVGKLVEALQSRGILDDTLLIITADHGENLGERGMLDHMLSMYETTIRVPLVMRHPDSFVGGSQSEELVSLVDILPTILHICGLESRYPELVKRSLLSEDRVPHEFVIAENERPLNGVEFLQKEFPEFDTTRIDHPMRMLRTNQHKLIWYGDGHSEVYDLHADPSELDDLSLRDPDLRDRLLAQLKTWESSQEAHIPTTPIDISDPETRDQLRALGYVE